MERIDKFSVILNKKDDFGNEIIFDSKTNKIVLTLKSDSIKRDLGEIKEKDNKLFYFKREKEGDIYKNMNAWTINKHIATNVDYIVYQTDKGNYVMDTDTAWTRGTQIGKPGVDKKLAVPLNLWKVYFDNPITAFAVKTLGYSWGIKLWQEFDKEYMKTLAKTIRSKRNTETVYPDSKDVFNAFRLTSFENTKVVIIGQEPYNDGSDHGLAFSKKDDENNYLIPSSLKNIFDELEKDVYDGLLIDKDPDLEKWAVQGVFLPNICLTVEKSKLKSHSNLGWEIFMKKAIQLLNDEKENLVFILWGAEVQPYAQNIDETKHLVLKANHPAPMTANEGFFGCKHFSKANSYLKENRKKVIKW